MSQDDPPHDAAEREALVPYRYGTPPCWYEGVKKLVPMREAGKALLRGSCPRCGHTMDVSLEDYEGPAFGIKRPGRRTISGECNCNGGHDDHHIGCGANGGIDVEF